MSEIPRQKVEVDVTIRMFDESIVNATIFLLPSHESENPIDSLKSFLNQRRSDFFPARMRDGAELLLPLRHCYTFELKFSVVERLLQEHPRMSRESLVNDESSVMSYALVSLTLLSRRVVKGSLWFHYHVPETERNILDALNGEARYMTVHLPDSICFVRRDAIQGVRARDAGDIAKSTDAGAIPSVLSRQRPSSLVDVEYQFADESRWATPLPVPREDKAEGDETDDEHIDRVPGHLGAGQGYAPLTPSRVVPMPQFEDDEIPLADSAGEDYVDDEDEEQDQPNPPVDDPRFPL